MGVSPQRVDEEAEREALAYNKRIYAGYYRNPLLLLPYVLL